MHELINFNTEFFRADEALLAAASAAALYGRGIFTTVAIFDGKPFLWDKHCARLRHNAAKIRLELNAISDETLAAALSATIEKNNCRTGRARLTIFDRAPGRIWRYAESKSIAFSIMTADFQRAKADFRLTLSPYQTYSRSPLAGVKSCSYLENMLAADEARERGFDEAVRLNERGEIVSACAANIFWIKNDELFTAPLSAGGLRGTTRDFLMEKVPTTEMAATADVLTNADAIFITSAGLGVVQVSEFDGVRPSKMYPEITRTMVI